MLDDVPCAEAAHGKPGDIDAGFIHGHGLADLLQKVDDQSHGLRWLGRHGVGVGTPRGIHPLFSLGALGGDDNDIRIGFLRVSHDGIGPVGELADVVIPALACAMKEEDERELFRRVFCLGHVDAILEGLSRGGTVSFRFEVFRSVRELGGDEGE